MRIGVVILGMAVLLAGLIYAAREPLEDKPQLSRPQRSPQPATQALTAPEKIVAAAKDQIGTEYCAKYFQLAYPNGDPPRGKGACADVVVRSLRAAGIDLQVLIHEDMVRRFKEYPQKWGRPGPDSNIDHRRVPNHVCFLNRFGTSLPLEVPAKNATEWKPGDIVYWKLNNGLDHCGVISDTLNSNGLPLVIHNIGRCCEEDCLTKWKIAGHFRYSKTEN